MTNTDSIKKKYIFSDQQVCQNNNPPPPPILLRSNLTPILLGLIPFYLRLIRSSLARARPGPASPDDTPGTRPLLGVSINNMSIKAIF